MFSRPSRIALPFVVVGVIAAGAVVPTVRAAASPHLAAVTPQHLVEKVLNEKVSHMSGTFEWRAQLGLPSLSNLGVGGGQGVSTSSGFDPTSLLSGTHTFSIWIDGPWRQRIAAPASLSETDVVHRGNQAWLYNSSTNHVTHYVLRARRPGSTMPAQPLDGASVPALAANILRSVRSVGTDVSVGANVTVAGRPAYVLRVKPDRAVAANRGSTVSVTTIAVDAKTGLPLRVSIYAVGQGRPALQVGFSSVSYGTPSASMFAVPKGQSTSTRTVSPTRPTVGGHSGAADRSVLGRDWGTIAVLTSGPSLGGSSARSLDAVTTVVTGSWGSGRLLTSTLVNALILTNGHVLIGMVTPATLENAASHLAA